MNSLPDDESANDNYSNFVVEYRWGGETWGMTILARSWEEANQRRVAIGLNGVIKGSNAIVIPVQPKVWAWLFLGFIAGVALTAIIMRGTP